MCNITRKTKRKTADMYKVVFKHENNYYGFYSCMKINIGEVISEDIANDNISRASAGHGSIFTIDYSKNTIFYGKISGFIKLKDAKILFNTYPKTSTIIKLKITGDIYEGDGTGIGSQFTGEEKTLFGTEVISFKEIKV